MTIDLEDPQEEPAEEQVLDINHPPFVLLRVRRGVDHRLEQIWDICQQYGAHIIGGYVRFMISPDEHTAPANDVDIFLDLKENETMEGTQQRYKDICDRFETIYDMTHNGPLSSYYYDETGGSVSVNVIMPRSDETMVTIGSIYEIMEMFDFPIVRCALRSLEVASADPDFLVDEKEKRLQWKHINCPVAAVFRMMKYSKKGYFARPKEVAKLFIDWDNRTPEYRERLLAGLAREDPDEDQINELETLLWVD